MFQFIRQEAAESMREEENNRGGSERYSRGGGGSELLNSALQAFGLVCLRLIPSNVVWVSIGYDNPYWVPIEGADYIDMHIL